MSEVNTFRYHIGRRPLRDIHANNIMEQRNLNASFEREPDENEAERIGQTYWQTQAMEDLLSREVLFDCAKVQGVSRRAFMAWAAAGFALSLLPKALEANSDQGTSAQEERSPRAIERFKELTGVDLGQLRESFNMNLEVENGAGRYVIFLPQFHHVGGDVRSTAEKHTLSDLIAHHKELGAALEHLKEKGANNVSSEGVYDMGYFEKLKAFKVKLNAIEAKQGALKEFIALYDEAKSLKRCGSDLVTYLLLLKFCEIDGTYDAKPEYALLLGKDLHRLIAMIESMESFIMDVGARDEELLGEQPRGIAGLLRPSSDMIYLWGADVARYLRGEADMLPAELESAKIEQHVFERLYNRGLESLSAEERKKIFDVRENIAIDLIARRGEQLSPLLYGNAHSFKKSIEAYNAKHLEASLGLLTITPKKVTVRGRRGFVELCPEGEGGEFGMRISNRGATQ